MSSDLTFLALINDDYKRVVQTAQSMQATVMRLAPGESIGSESHAEYDQLVVTAAGNGIVTVDGRIIAVGPGSVVLIPGGAMHDVVNTHPADPLRLLVVYAPPKFRDGEVIKH